MLKGGSDCKALELTLVVPLLVTRTVFWSVKTKLYWETLKASAVAVAEIKEAQVIQVIKD